LYFSGTLDATQFGDVCIQPAGIGVIGSEDCLYLNIWTHDDDVVRPVIVFLHGGAANGAGGSSPTLDGAALAEAADVIVVTVNRRLGILGYLAIDELIAEKIDEGEDPALSTAGNYAVLDVQMALRWLTDYIFAFNGDPGGIMLAGQSSGGGVVCDVLSSPDSLGLLDAAALHSPGCFPRQVLNEQVGVPTDEEYAVVSHREVVDYFGCDAAADVLDCLRALPAEDLVMAQDVLGADFAGIIDGVVITADAADALANNVAGDIPVIVGSTLDESRNIFTPNPFVEDDAEYQQLLGLLFDPPLDGQLYALYPTADYPSANDAFHTLMSDLLFGCRAERLANAAEGGAPAYLFTFSRGFDNGPLAGMGATHTIDVFHLFRTFDVVGYTPDQPALDIATAMGNAWRSLAADPMAPPPYLASGSSAWPAHTEASPQVVVFDDTITTASQHRGGRCPELLALF
jgi:para-nitrobenzyl esterase